MSNRYSYLKNIPKLSNNLSTRYLSKVIDAFITYIFVKQKLIPSIIADLESLIPMLQIRDT
jgi:hypothetical protein